MKLRTILATFLAIFTLAACSDSPMPMETAATDALSVAELTLNQEISPASHSPLHIPITGTAGGEQVFEGFFTVQEFIVRQGQLFARGTLTGQLNVGGVLRNITRTILLPVTLPPNQATCDILDLTLGPLDLTLLGLRVQLSQIDLVITADPAGGLLGALLCAVANLLNTGGPLQQIANLLNQIIGILG